ncbi:MAG: SGNH/GDSL hydrolase family protein [Lachnospiraceae bacterium]|nr:SGNH/GDSL hydrolase family protein [Lachnospiraceae bacterium]
MKNSENRGRRLNSKYILYGIMICFCILALTEILYGQVQKKKEQERLALEEANSRELLEIEEERADIGNSDEAAKNDVADGQEPVSENVNEIEEDIDLSGQQDETEEGKKYDMQIVIMGDSILDSVRDSDGVASLIGENCNADVYNMSIGGTTAALVDGEEYNYNNWTSISLLGIVNAILGNISKDVFSPYRAGEILNECDFSKTDYFVIEYGVNDFTAKIPCGRYFEDGVTPTADEAHTYVGALELAISMLHDAFPDAKILLVSPHYCQFFSGERYLGDAYSIDYGWGALIAYKDMCSNIYNQHKQDNVLFYDTFVNSGIDAYTADDYLEDGIHLTEAGRRSYADYAAKIIKTDFFPVE